MVLVSMKKTLRSWMLRILSYLNGNPLLLPSFSQSFSSSSSSFLHPAISSQLLPSFSVLSDFLKTFLAKMEHLNKVVLGRDCEVFPVIPMGKIFEPMNLIFSYVLHTAKKLKVIFSNIFFVSLFPSILFPTLFFPSSFSSPFLLHIHNCFRSFFLFTIYIFSALLWS